MLTTQLNRDSLDTEFYTGVQREIVIIFRSDSQWVSGLVSE